MTNESGFHGFLDLENQLKDIISKVEKSDDVLEDIAQESVKDLLKLPKPKSKIRKTGYTHLVNSFTYKKTTKDIEVGWGKYYGLMVEKGTIKNRPQPHLRPTIEKNMNKYVNMARKKLNLK